MELEEVKNYLHLYDNFDDIFLSQLIEIADIYVEKIVGDSYLKDNKLIKLANLLKLKYIEDMYDNRNTTISNNIKEDRMTTTIIEILRNSDIDE